MLSLPSLAPPDCYTLWYTSSNSPNPYTISDHDDPEIKQTQNQYRHQSIEYRNPLTNLKLDEESVKIRKKNITDYGAAWLKPPGIRKSLQQIREEEREMKEHEESLIRERNAREYAIASTHAEQESYFQAEQGMADMVDLDDEVPEANSSGFYSNEGSEFDDEGSENTEISAFMTHNFLPSHDDLYRREALVHERLIRDDSSTVDEKDLSGMLLEEDLIQEQSETELVNVTIDVNQDIDLDEEIPDGDGYEHTDIEELTSSDDDDDDDEGKIFEVDLVKTEP